MAGSSSREKDADIQQHTIIPISIATAPIVKSKGEMPAGTGSKTLLFCVLYAVSSSCLSIVNKWAIRELPLPGVVTACQFFATSGFVWTIGRLGFIEVEPLELRRVAKMLPINVIFYLAILSNTKVLQYSTVETFIAFRSLTPLLVSAVDSFVRGSPWPSPRTVACLMLIALAAAGYAEGEEIATAGYLWAIFYLVVIVVEMVYAKHITSTIGLSTWGLVLYQNAIALAIWPFFSLITGEFNEIADYWFQGDFGAQSTPAKRLLLAVVQEKGALFTSSCVAPLLVSAFLSTSISFASWGTRAAISATQFTVLGLACKLATVAMNFAIWDDHAPLESQGYILVCIFASLLYSKSAAYDKAKLAEQQKETREVPQGPEDKKAPSSPQRAQIAAP